MLDPKIKEEIDAMSHEDLCRKWRFALPGSKWFLGEVGAYFTDRLFKHFGGFTPEISKKIGH